MTIRRHIADTYRSGASAVMPLTALIDVVFLVLIFFLFSSFDFSEVQVLTSLSRAEGTAVSASESVWLRVRRGPTGQVEYAVDDGPFTSVTATARESISAGLSRSVAPGGVIVDAETGVLLQELLDAFSLARQAGAGSVALRAEEESS